ncbi:MAG: TRAP transporter small permease [Planctomycetes bacterium]|jgi:TRAP-type C4-dicarboxylate transport system permease small subunit|nr:TRAP transporter small permease [Planctomycetota bacterium]
MQNTAEQQTDGILASVLRRVVRLLAAVAGLAIAAMIVVTCVDVVGRRVGYPLPGTYDLIELLGAIVIAGALPYTTACRGHVAIEFLPRQLPPRGRIVLSTVVGLVFIALFAFLTWRFVQYGVDLAASGQVTLTLRWPVFWLPHWIAVCTAATILVLLYQVTHPGKELMKP